MGEETPALYHIASCWLVILVAFLSAPDESRVRIKVYVQPNAPKNEIVGIHGESLKVKVKAPPLDHAANDECAKFLAEIFGIKRGAVALLIGEKSREKVFEIYGLTLAEAAAVFKTVLTTP